MGSGFRSLGFRAFGLGFRVLAYGVYMVLHGL